MEKTSQKNLKSKLKDIKLQYDHGLISKHKLKSLRGQILKK